MSARLSLPPSPASPPPPLLLFLALPGSLPDSLPTPRSLEHPPHPRVLTSPHRAKLNYNGVSEIMGDLSASALAQRFFSRPSDMVQPGHLQMRLAVLFASIVYVARHIGSFTTNSQQQAEQFAEVVWCISPHKTTGAVSLGIVFCAGHLKDCCRKK